MDFKKGKKFYNENKIIILFSFIWSLLCIYYIINDKFYHNLPLADLILIFLIPGVLLCGGYMGNGKIPGFCNETILGSIIYFIILGVLIGWVLKIYMRKRINSNKEK